MLNKVILIGNLGGDPEVRHTEGGASVCNLSLAVSRKWKKDGKLVEETEWIGVVVWGAQVDACAQYLRKGRQVCVEGRLHTREWLAKDGQQRKQLEVVAERVVFLGGGDRQQKDAATAPAPKTQPPADDDIPF